MNRHSFLKHFLITAAVCGFSGNLTSCTDPANDHPNIVFILADDLGYGDISCLNEDSKIQTKYIDQLAEEGVSFRDAHSGSSVCTPTRYGVLTGRYSWRTRLKKGVTWSYDEHLINPRRMTVASMLRDNGYHTAAIGKWHLGLDWQKGENGVVDLKAPIENGPNVYGFDYFYGIPASLDIPPYVYIENNRVTAASIDTVRKNDGMGFWRRGPIGDDFKHADVLPHLTQKALSYIRQQAETDNPFFLYFPLPAPHTPILPSAEFIGKSGTNAYGDFVLMVDDVVGQILRALKENGIDDNTLLIFTSDNGCSPMANFEELGEFGHDPSYVFRGHKGDIFEGGHRIPFVARWPRRIKASQQSKETICLTDLMATCAAIVNHSLPDNSAEDSYNLLPIFFGEKLENPTREATVHHSENGNFSIRQGSWKLSFCPGSGGWSYPTPEMASTMDILPIQLYDLESDPGETDNLAGEFPEKVEQLVALMTGYIEMGRSTAGAPQRNEGETQLLPEGYGAFMDEMLDR
jgi:arylsulfatase A-like enzyme